MNMKTNIFRGLKYLAILVVTFISLVLVINLSIFDEELSPEVAAMFEKQQQTIEPDNAYIAMWGITAGSNKDFIDAGIELMQRHYEINSSSENSILTDLDMEQILGDKDLDRDWRERYKSCGARTRSGCLKEVSEVIKKNPIQDSRLQLMLERYSKMLKMTKYQLLMDIHAASLIPSYSEIMRLGQIRTASAFITEDTMSTLTAIEEDLKFWRMILLQSGDLLNKMIAVAAAWKDYSYLSEIIKKQELSQLEKQKIASILVEISSEELDMTSVFYSETKWLFLALDNEIWSDEIDEIFSISREFILPLWQKNATLNHIYFRNHLPLICLSKLSDKDFYKFRVKNNSYCEFPSEDEINNYHYSLYNPGGMMLVSVGIPGYTNYIARVHDLNGVISLVKLQLELKSVADEDIENIIKKSSIRNLYTDEPMNYDKEKNEIGFDCLDKGSVCKISL